MTDLELDTVKYALIDGIVRWPETADPTDYFDQPHPKFGMNNPNKVLDSDKVWALKHGCPTVVLAATTGMPITDAMIFLRVISGLSFWEYLVPAYKGTFIHYINSNIRCLPDWIEFLEEREETEKNRDRKEKGKNGK